MDLDNLQQNMNTRVVFKEPRGMVRWLQLFFAIIAVSTVCDFYTTIGINITCPTTNSTTTTPKPPSSSSLAPVSSSSSSTAPTVSTPESLKQDSNISAQEQIHPVLVIEYPFDFSTGSVNNTCPKYTASYTHVGALNGSPQFFVMTGFLSLIYASGTLVVYLLFSSTYDSIPVMPVADLIIAAILCLFWFIASSSFSSGVSLLKSTVTYDNLKQVLCPNSFIEAGGVCLPDPEFASWKSINVGLLSGFASFFLWGAGLWFVYKETHFHTPRGPL